jgi:WD40 repeat protein
MTRQRRVGLFLAITAIAVAVIVIYVGVTLLSSSDDDATVRGAGPAAGRIAKGDLLLLDRDRKHPKAWGRLVLIGRDGERRIGKLACERVAFAGGSGICLAQARSFPAPSYEARLFDADEKVTAKIDVPGSPSRARVSPDGRYAASTTFVGGDSYTNPGAFSTRTRVYDVQAGESLGDLEEYTVTKDGKVIDAQDFNFWGVTFTGISAQFYATLGTGKHHYLVRGNALTQQVRVIRDGVECPSLSPDGTRLAFKARVGSPFQWRFHVLNLETGKETALEETRSVDDQISWLDDRTLAYGVDEEVMEVPADGSSPPRRMMAGATNPSRVG